jgi:3-polyprenyl-4-hydroxybenzoate decarboxylase
MTDMYGGDLKHNPRVVIHCMTYRKGGIYQHATVGGAHPGFTDNMLQLPAIESDIFNDLLQGGINVSDVRCPAAGLSNIAYAKIKPQGGGDAKQALLIMLTCSKQGLPKIAMVFDEDVDIWNDDRIAQCMASRYMSDRDTLIIPQCNTMSTDPKIGDVDKPFYASKIGLDCTIPMVGNWDRHDFDGSAAVDLGEPPAGIKPTTADDLVAEMTAFIRQAPRSWKEILQKYHGQPTRQSIGYSVGCVTSSAVPGTLRGSGKPSVITILRMNLGHPSVNRISILATASPRASAGGDSVTEKVGNNNCVCRAAHSVLVADGCRLRRGVRSPGTKPGEIKMPSPPCRERAKSTRRPLCIGASTVVEQAD